MSFNCGGISDTCAAQGWTFTYTYDGVEYVKSWELVDEIIYSATFMINQALIRMTNSMTVNMQKGFNSLKCAFSSGFINVALLLEAAYYALRQFGLQAFLVDLIDEYYPYLCTCTEDVNALGEWLGNDQQTQANFASCNETAYDQCDFPIDNGDGTFSCVNCADYYYDSDTTACLPCEDAEYDGTSYSCNADCANYNLNSDGDACEYDCTAVETDADGTDYCKCSDYTLNGAACDPPA